MGVCKSIRLHLKMVKEEDVFKKKTHQQTILIKERTLVPPKPYTSKIWKYFEFKVDDNNKKYAFCELCGTKLKYCCNTMNMGDAFKRSTSTILCKV